MPTQEKDWQGWQSGIMGDKMKLKPSCSPPNASWFRNLHVRSPVFPTACMAHPFYHDWRIHYMMTYTSKIFSKFQKIIWKFQKFFSNLQNYFWNLQNISFIPVAYNYYTHSSINDSSSHHHFIPSLTTLNVLHSQCEFDIRDCGTPQQNRKNSHQTTFV